jgi:GNAT superfamily N-acetyltransferase
VLPSPVVRPRERCDLPTLVRSLGEQQPTSSYPMRWPLPFPVEQFIERDGQERAWVAVLDGRVVGHVGVGRPRGDVERAFLDALTVDDTAGLGIVEVLFTDLSVRGTGIGGLLLDTAVAWLHEQGLTPVLDVVTDHGTALDVYRHRGWRQVGSIRPPWLPESKADLLLMVLPSPTGLAGFP